MMRRQFVIEPKKPKRHNWRIGTFDIETKPVNGESSLLAPYSLGATCLDGEGDTVKYWHYPVLMLEYLLSFKDTIRWYCHNGGGFDFRYIIGDKHCQEWLTRHGYAVHIIGGKIAKALMFKKGKKVCLVCDSYKLMPSTLAKLCADFKVKNAKGHINFEEGEVFDMTNEKHIEYLNNDVIGLWQVVTKYREIVNVEFGTEIKCTASSTAFAAWCTLIEKPVYHHANVVNDFARKAYYGGRTECLYQGNLCGMSYIDVNSLYAYIMLEYGALQKPYYTKELAPAGFYRVKAFVPDVKFAPLPYRKPDGTGVLFPTGHFETYCSSIEIEFALTLGCTVEILEGFAFDVWDKDTFKPFINKCMEIRQRDYYGALGQAAKFLQNNLYGFFGMNPEREELLYSPYLPDEEGFNPCFDDHGNMVDNLWSRLQSKETLNCIPAFAAWITSAARVYLLKAMIREELAGNRVAYCDTDSIVLQGEPANKILEGEYGAFKLEYLIEVFTGVTAKTYSHTSDGKTETKCKGIPKKKLKPQMMQDALRGKTTKVEFVQNYSLARTLKTGEYGNEFSTRSIPIITSITNRVPGVDGWTMPIKLNG